MQAENLNDLVIKESDYQKLSGLIESTDSRITVHLEDELSKAEVVQDDEYPGDAVCMGSRVKFINLVNKKEGDIQLVYPQESSVQDMKISILTPMGCALIGMRVGGIIDWIMPNGKMAKIKVVSITQMKLE